MIRAVNVPSCDDCGDWYVEQDGKLSYFSFWSKQEAEYYIDHVLWSKEVVSCLM